MVRPIPGVNTKPTGIHGSLVPQEAQPIPGPRSMTSDKAPPAGQTTRKPPRKGKTPGPGARAPRFGKAGKPRGGQGAPRRAGPPGAIDVAILYGWHPVAEALANPQRRPRRLMATENAHKRLLERFEQLPIAPEIVRPGEIDRLLEPDAVHQGLLL